MFVAHTATTPTPLTVRIAVAILAGLGAAAVMNIPVTLLYYGGVPLRVAASALFDDPISEVSDSETAAVHYASGMVAGVLFEAVVFVAERIQPPTARVVAGLVSIAEIIGAVLVAAFVYALFVEYVFPEHGGVLYEDEEDREATRRHWAVCAAVFGVALLALLPALYLVLPV